VDYALHHANACLMHFLKRNFEQAGDRYLEQVGYEPHKLDIFYQIEKYIWEKRGLVKKSTLTTIREVILEKMK